jgi:DNA replication protein DnaC
MWDAIMKMCPFDLSNIKPKSPIDIYNEAVGNLNDYDCDICRNKGIVAIDYINGELKTKICECMQKRSRLKAEKESGIEYELKSKTFDNYRTESKWQQYIKAKAQEYCSEGADRWFFIGGQCGSGKTHICCAISNEFIKKGKSFKYMEWMPESKELKALANDISYAEKINQFKRYDVLYIDDFMKVKQGEKPTGADVNIAFEILNSRSRDRSKITIISSEFNMDELLAIDEGTMSRINERAKPFVYQISKGDDKNYRMKE